MYYGTELKYCIIPILLVVHILVFFARGMRHNSSEELWTNKMYLPLQLHARDCQ